jgi:regulator of sigma E protease
MEYIIKGGQLLLSLSILIVLHEFGHYLPAKWFKTRVEKFYLFFDYKFSIFKKKIGETQWGIGWIPLGGYVKISGMIDESMDKEQMKKEPEEWEFRAKPAWQRLIIMIGGVTVNLVLGILIYMMVIFAWGRDYLTNNELDHGLAVHEHFEQFGFKDGDKILTINGEIPFSVDMSEITHIIALRGGRKIEVEHLDGQTEVLTLPEDIDMTMFKEGAMQAFSPRHTAIVDSVLADKPAKIAGLLKGDSIISVNGHSTVFWDEFTNQILTNKSKTVSINFYRNNNLMSSEIVVDSVGVIGVLSKGFDIEKIQHKSYAFSESVSAGFNYGIQTLKDYVSQMKYIFTSKGAGSVGGFGAIGGMFSPTWDWHSFWANTAFISIILAFMNILPIPALDGGHIMFLLYEIITGRKPNEKLMEYAQAAGMILLLGLLLYANGNDIFKAIFG